MMKFPILLLSVILSVRALDVRVGFDGISSPPGTYTMYIDSNYNDDWVPIDFNYTFFVDVEAPSPTQWTYSINDVPIASGTEDFCDPTPMTPGGIAMQILRYGFDLNDKPCPFPRYTKGTNVQWTWAEAKPLDLDEIFNAAATILAGGSLDGDVSVDADANPPDSGSAPEPGSASGPGSGAMKRRRRDSSLVSVKLEILNSFVDTSFILSASV